MRVLEKGDGEQNGLFHVTETNKTNCILKAESTQSLGADRTENTASNSSSTVACATVAAIT
jgi:hypothetical protein